MSKEKSKTIEITVDQWNEVIERIAQLEKTVIQMKKDHEEELNAIWRMI